jgi:dCTP deaminase
MILTGNEILEQIGKKRITIDPFEAKRVNPASVDLTLGDHVGIYEEFALMDGADQIKSRGKPYDGSDLYPFNVSRVYDTKKSATVRRFKIDPTLGWVIRPGIGYLMHTAERVTTDFYVPVLDGKSSIGRIFVKIHETAGYADPGYDGQFTLEVTTSMFSVRLYPGMRICQVRFHTVEGELTSYRETGHYKGDAAQGAIGSRVHESSFD